MIKTTIIICQSPEIFNAEQFCVKNMIVATFPCFQAWPELDERLANTLMIRQVFAQ